MVVIVLGCLASSILGVFVSIKYFQLVSTNQVPEDNLSSIINIRDGVTALTVSMEVIMYVVARLHTWS